MSVIEQYLREKLKIKSATVGFVLRGDEVLLGERIKSSTDLGLGKLSGLGGEQNPAETDEDTNKREIKEESDLDVLRAQEMGRVVFLFPEVEKWTQSVAVFVIAEGDYEGEAKQKEEKIIPHWIKRAEFPWERMWPDNAVWVPEVLKGNKVDGIFVLDPKGNILEHRFEVLAQAS
jgi:8-oxo-dGTP diphosphatase